MRHSEDPLSTESSSSDDAYKPRRRRSGRRAFAPARGSDDQDSDASSEGSRRASGKSRRDSTSDEDDDEHSSWSSDDSEQGGGAPRPRRKRGRRKSNLNLVVVLGIGGLIVLMSVLAVLAYKSDDSSYSESAFGPSSVAEPSKTSHSKSVTGIAASGTTSKASPAPSSSASAVAISGSSDASSATAWIPVKKIRGVNLGSLFVFEPWMAGTSWKALGCEGHDSEWQCIEALGLDKVQAGFENHWNTFYKASDFTEMAAVGLNTVRIPLGFWTVDSLIGDDYFPKGSWKYVKQVVEWAKDAGLYIILDLHGAPGSQTTAQAFTGHTVDEAGFFTTENFQRAVDCLSNWTTEVHTNDIFSTVVMIQVVNEPLQDTSATGTMLSEFYPNALKAVRDAEAALGISCDDSSYACLGVQFMDKAWGSGDPTTDIDTTDHVIFDDHGYAQWIADEQSRAGYLKYLCTTTRSTDMSPIIVGEWSLSAMQDKNDEFKLDSEGATVFYQQFAAAQLLSAEKGAGWVFWSWKTELGDPRWSYQESVAATFFPTELDTIDKTACDGYT